MTRRLRDWLRTIIGFALVIVAVLACAAVDMVADDREGGR